MIRVYLGVLSILGMVFLSVIYCLRSFCRTRKIGLDHWLAKANRYLRKMHKPLGAAVILMSLAHGILAFRGHDLPTITGKLCFLMLLLLLLTYFLRSQLKKQWITLHRLLTVLLWLLVIGHVVLQIG